MTEEQLLSIITKKNEHELFSFLRTYTAEQKKQLVPVIKKLIKHFHEFGTRGILGSYGYLHGTTEHRELMQMVAFICFNRSDYEKTPYAIWILNKKHLSKIIDWYCPPWFNDYVNKLAEANFFPHYINYSWVMELQAKGILQPNKEVLVTVIPRMIFEQNAAQNLVFVPENLLKEKVTLEEHIWYLFEFPSDINFNTQHLRLEVLDTAHEASWMGVFKRFTREKRLDRMRVIRESLLASSRNFNKGLSGWFAELYVSMEPTLAETLQLQKELLILLSSPHSKVVNTALQSIKTMVAEKEFETAPFLDNIPLLVSSNTKATVAAVLTILEKLAKQSAASRQSIVLMVCQCFIQTEEALQTKAAKIIAKYGDAENTELREALAGVQSTMLSAARLLLTKFINALPHAAADLAAENPNGNVFIESSALPAIVFPESVDDLFFLASQAFDNNQVWHIDMLPAALIHFQPRLTAADLQRFEPAFQRAVGLMKGGYRSGMGLLDNLLAHFFVDYGNWLTDTFPAATAGIREILNSATTNNGVIVNFRVAFSGESFTKNWNTRKDFSPYKPFKMLLLAALDKIKQSDVLPLLRTPTHEPCWVSADILISRLRAYHLTQKEPAEIDLEVAISRCRLPEITNEMETTLQQLSGEMGRLLSFLFLEDASPEGPFTYKAAWMVASLSRKHKTTWPAFEDFTYYKNSINNYTGELQWNVVKEPFKSMKYDAGLRKNIDIVATRKVARIFRDKNEDKKTGLKKLFSGLLPGSKEDPPMLYDQMNFSTRYMSVEEHDIKRIIGLVPNNTAPLLIDIFNNCLQYPDFWEEAGKRTVIAALEMLYEIWPLPGPITVLFLGNCMLSGDKTVSNIAAELWLKAVSEQTINNTALGSVMGIHERSEFAPLKRFLDMAMQKLFRVSALHNSELQVLIENILVELPNEPIKNLKKLLEIYQELLALNNTTITPRAVIDRLKAWQSNTGLQKIVVLLMNRFVHEQ